jgi:hypothetical protein
MVFLNRYRTPSTVTYRGMRGLFGDISLVDIRHFNLSSVKIKKKLKFVRIRYQVLNISRNFLTHFYFEQYTGKILGVVWRDLPRMRLAQKISLTVWRY